MTTTHDIQPGDFFVSCWGYDQTNIDYYRVIATTKAGVKIQKWANKVVDGRVVPGDQAETVTDRSKVTADIHTDHEELLAQVRAAQVPGPVKLKKVKLYGSEPFLDLTSYSNAYLWDGRPKFDTLAAGEAGH